VKTPNHFRNRDEWQAYVRATVPPDDVPFTLAMGLTDLYREFYQMRSQPFPEGFSLRIERASKLAEPERTRELEAVNEAIMLDSIRFLRSSVPATSAENDYLYSTTPRGAIEDLQEHLRTKNPYFALWTHYTNKVAGKEGAPEWRDYVKKTMGVGEDREIDFALLISDMGRCLEIYYQREMRLPKRFYFQIWFLYRSHGPERNAMTRALMQELVEGLEPCGSA